MKSTSKFRCGHDVTQPIYLRGENRKRWLETTDCASCALEKAIHYSRSLSVISPVTGQPYSLGDIALRFIKHVKREQLAVRLQATK